MPKYIVDTTPTKNNIQTLHEIDCPHVPDKKHSIAIGYYTECSSALRYLRIKNPTSHFSGCKYCCRSCCEKINTNSYTATDDR